MSVKRLAHPGDLSSQSFSELPGEGTGQGDLKQPKTFANHRKPLNFPATSGDVKKKGLGASGSVGKA